MTATEFSAFLKEEVRKIKGIAYPIKASFPRRFFIKRAPRGRLHPNPNDEFCFPEIGPNQEIVSHYMTAYSDIIANPSNIHFADPAIREPIMVERIHPDGYMILNGHHRWGAACRVGMKKLRIKIVNLTQESDLRKMLASATSTRRVTLDLDEVVFRPEDDPFLEDPLRFPLKKWYKERLRLGIPALFHALNNSGYDIWIYTASYYSMEYLQYYFRHYNVRVTGIVTGLDRKAPAGTDTRTAMEALLRTRYQTTLHIDNESVIRTHTDSASFDEYPLSGDGASWSREIMELLEKMKKDE